VTIVDVAKEAVKGLAGSPPLLMVAVLNVVMLGSVIYIAKSQREERSELTRYVIECHK
jgi:hypothetical protein